MVLHSNIDLYMLKDELSKIGIPESDIKAIVEWNRMKIRANDHFKEDMESLSRSPSLSQRSYTRKYEMKVLPIIYKARTQPIKMYEMGVFHNHVYNSCFCDLFDMSDIEMVEDRFFRSYPALKDFFEAIDLEDFLKKKRKNIHSIEKNDISEFAKYLIVMADEGNTSLQEWIVNIWHAWDELHVLRKPMSKGKFKWRSGNLVQLTDCNDPHLYFEPTILYHGDEKVIYEWKLIEKYAHETLDLFECFFRIFPKIDMVKTELISGMRFENPFAAVSELPIKIKQQEFHDNALLCIRSPEFNEQWKQLQGKETIPVKKKKNGKRHWDEIKEIRLEDADSAIIKINNGETIKITKENIGSTELWTDFCQICFKNSANVKGMRRTRLNNKINEILLLAPDCRKWIIENEPLAITPVISDIFKDAMRKSSPDTYRGTQKYRTDWTHTQRTTEKSALKELNDEEFINSD
ncbi:MAG: hypothetical protein JW913_19630 [Chitinispirillaceae bacterium]|nr:hypothetical protein [Chitinispirillaceae bacterium]